MGKKSQPAPPKPVDPFEVAQADAQYNRIDQFTPFGNLTFSGPERNVANLTLSPELQQAFGLQSQVDINSLQEALRRQATSQEGSLPGLVTELDQSQFGAIPGMDDFAEQRDLVSQSLFDRQRSLLDPVFQQREQELRGDLANQGLPQASEAFANDLGTFNRGMGETYGRAALDATLAGSQEQSRLFNQALQSRAAEIQTQLQNANLAQSARSQLQNELAQVLGQQQLAQPGLQNFFTPGQADVTGGFGLNAQMQNNAFNARSQAASNAKSGFTDTLGGGIGALYSDVRLKDKVTHIGDDGVLKLYAWKWNDKAKELGVDWQPDVGFIAQEVQEIYPEAVVERDGYLAIDFAKLNEVH